MKTVLNFDTPNNRENKLFLGEPCGISNFADMKYPIFKQLYKEQLSFLWFPDEISMVKDAADIDSMSKTEKFIFESNLSFQTVGDSFLGKGIDGIIEYITNNEARQSFKVHSFFEESIHTPSYSHVIENIYNDPAEKFYSIMKNPEIQKRAEESTKRFNDLLNNNGNDVRGEIINTLIGLLALESISFYNSFLTSFYFLKNGKMSGAGSIIKLIARDENLHKANSINALKILRTREEEGFIDLKDEINDKIVSSFELMANQEFSWIDYLFSEGDLDGLSKNSAKQYVKYLTNKALGEANLKVKIFEDIKNPFPWVTKFQGSSKGVQVAPQEKEVVNYVKGGKNDIGNMNFKFNYE